MSQKTKKVAVLSLLRQHSTPISLSILMNQLGDGFAERSVRRWLSEMIEAGLVKKIGEKRATHYQAVIESIFKESNQRIIQHIKQPLFLRSPATYNFSWLNHYKPNTTAYLPKKIIKELHLAGEPNKKSQPPGTYAHHIYHRLLIDLSYHSSRLEGNTYSLLETQQLILEGEKASNKLSEETTMILNHKEAIRYLVDNAPKIKINENVIYTVHFLLSDGLVPSKFSGKIRDHGVRISGSVYVPIENPNQLEQQLKLICEKAAQIQEPFEASFFVLVHLAYLQAFTDVNKRTSRLCANISLIKNNLIPLSFNDISQEDYIDAMISIYELNNVKPLIDLYVFSYLRTCELHQTIFDAFGFDEVRVRYRQERRNILRHIILNNLHNKAMNHYIQQQSKSVVNKDELEQFIQDIYEDIDQLNPSRIAGMGITKQQLQHWQKNHKT